MTWDPQQLAQQTGRTVVITGGAGGIGLEAARDLAGRGARVVLAVRDLAKGEAVRRELAGSPGPVSVVELDLADLASVAACAKTLQAEHGSLQALVCNAGVFCGPYLLTDDGFERQMATNHLGHAALTAALWPLLHTSAARVVVVTSLAARGGRITATTTREQLVDPGAGYEPRQAYDDSKQANLLFALELHRRAGRAGSPVSAVAAHPGVSGTSLFAVQHEEAGRPLRASLTRAVSRVALQSPSAGAQSILRALHHSTPSGAFVGPARFGQVRGRPELLDVYAGAADPAVGARLWELTEQALGVPLPG